MNAEVISDLLLCCSSVLLIHQLSLRAATEGFAKNPAHFYRLFAGQPLKMTKATQVLRNTAIDKESTYDFWKI